LTLETTDSSEARSRSARRFVHLAETDRLETFSDGVFAIVVTLLVLDLKEPQHSPGQLLIALVHQWPAYLAYFASFAYVAVIWLNHHQTFVGIQRVNRGVHIANMCLLFTTALIPFPTAGVAAAMCVSWLLLYHQVHRHRDRLLEEKVDREMFGTERARAIVGIVTYTVAGLVGALWLPAVALVAFIALPTFYGLTSEGLQAVIHRE
jgi:uncharacterized membrane protein